MKNSTISDWLNDLGSKQPTPGGGAVAGLNGAIASAQLKMICEYTKESDINEMAGVLSDKIQIFLDLADKDSATYLKVREAYKLKDDELLQSTSKDAANVSIEIVENCEELLDLIEANITKFNKNLLADLIVVIVNLKASIRSSKAMIDVNAESLNKSEDKDRILSSSKHCEELLGKADNLFKGVENV